MKNLLDLASNNAQISLPILFGILIYIILQIVAPPVSNPKYPFKTTGTFEYVTDGDTINFKIGKLSTSCRIYGVDSPEKYESDKMIRDTKHISKKATIEAGNLASDYAKNYFIKNKKYDLTIVSKDKYNRYVIIVKNGFSTYNESIVAAGYAVAVIKYIKDPKLRNALHKAQSDAMRKNRGLWKNYATIMQNL